MIIWLNGTFGAGKTTTGALLTQKSRQLRLFDPESVGYMLRPNLTDYPVTDFRHWESWRVLTPLVADELVRFSGQSLVAPQTVLEEQYWDAMLIALTKNRHDVLHVLLHAAPDVTLRRIEADEVESNAKAWRIRHLAEYDTAHNWLSRRADLIVDTTELSPQQVTNRIWDHARDRVI